MVGVTFAQTYGTQRNVCNCNIDANINDNFCLMNVEKCICFIINEFSGDVDIN